MPRTVWIMGAEYPQLSAERAHVDPELHAQSQLVAPAAYSGSLGVTHPANRRSAC